MKDDLIRRQTAIEALGERPMVWGNGDDYSLGERNQYDMDKLAIETVPAADAVPVIRCKDCKHHGHKGGIPYCSKQDYGYGWEDNDFCSKGDRKDG